MAIADKMRENHELAAATQQSLRNGRRVIRRVADDDQPIAIDKLPVLIEQPMPVAVPHTAITVSPLDLPAEHFSAGLERRKQNRHLLMEWLRTALVDGVDFGRIHVVSKERCQFAKQGRLKDCTDPYHWSKPSLFKPGAEKISGMLGVTVHFPSLPDYEKAVISQTEIKMILMRCELRDAQGRVVAEGVGARSLSQDYGDLNKSLKMVEKSAHIDATLRLAGLSEVFTQDIEDRAILDDDEPKSESPPKQKQALRKSPAKAAVGATSASNATDATPATPSSTEIISPRELASLRQRIAQHGFTEKRVLAWLYKTTEGTVTQLDQLTGKQCASLLKRLESWSEAEKSFANGKEKK
jgi:hypothetical protein